MQRRHAMMASFLDQRVLEHSRVTPDAPSVGTPSKWRTYAQLASTIDRLAASLQARGAGPGSFVLNMLSDGIASVACGLAIQRAGACVVEVNRSWGTDFIRNIRRETGARHLFLHRRDADFAGTLGERFDGVWIAHDKSPVHPESIPLGAAAVALDDCGDPIGPLDAFREMSRSADDLSVVLFTSASTGAPRGVMLTHGNIAANTESIVQYLDLTAADRVMSILPLSYSYGRSLLQTHLWVGGSIFLDHRFMYPRVVLESIGQQQCTGFAGVPVTFEILRRTCDPRAVAMRALRYVTQAGGAMHRDMRIWVKDAFAPAKFYVMYGQTEATARLAYLPPERFMDKPTSVGVAIPGVTLRVVDDEGREVAVDEIGHLIARGANVSRGYLNAPEETREILKDGWLWTGDLARCDADGYFTLVGRTRTMLKVSGHRFSPEEIEERIVEHPDVLEACVVGAPDPITGEASWAFVVLKGEATAPEPPFDPAALRRFCAMTLPLFKVPKHVIVVNSLPRSRTGKVKRAELEERARHDAAETAG